MFSIYSKSCEYTIWALIEIVADQNQGEKVTAKKVCKRAGIPEAYARKTFQTLVQKGFLTSITGPGGGYQGHDHAQGGKDDGFAIAFHFFHLSCFMRRFTFD